MKRRSTNFHHVSLQVDSPFLEFSKQYSGNNSVARVKKGSPKFWFEMALVVIVGAVP